MGRSTIDLDSVDFSYEGNDVFKEFNLSILDGQKIGLVGQSGAGKSTLVSLLLRLYDIQSGTIKIDGQNISEVTQESLRRNIAVIPQDTSLFHRSLMDNIRYGNLDASDDAVIEAAKKAHAHDFIMDLPDAYDTMVGERGVKLSGGQRQRIAIARAILKDAPILILDEATSALDSESERLIQDSLRTLMDGKTVIAIAHRLSTISHLDRLIVMDKGQIIEDGTHENLLNQNGQYAKLWSMQSGGFLGD
jgi:ABC-type multidrug transport system fused ATPase/permease subunit